MKEQLLAAWTTHQGMNLLLLDEIPDSALDLSLSKKGGRNVYDQLWHLCQVRQQWLDVIDKKRSKDIPPITKPAAQDRDALHRVLQESSSRLMEVFSSSWDNAGKMAGFKKGLIPFMAYLISHESHHRGNILLTIKQSGEKIPEKLKWNLWEWQK